MTGKMRAKQMEQDAVKEYGMVMNEGILTLSIIGEIEVMTAYHKMPKQPNMSTFCRFWQEQSRTKM